MNWLMRKLRSLLLAVVALVGLVVLVIVGAYALHAAGQIEDPMVLWEKFRSIDWKAQITSVLGSLALGWFFMELLFNDDNRYYYPHGGYRNGDQVTYIDRNRNGIPDEMERRNW